MTQDVGPVCGNRISMMCIGMSGNEDFRRLQAAFIRHGSETFRDISREATRQ